MLSGEVLSQWLQRRTGTLVQGSRISLGPQGLRISQTVDSAPVVVQLPVMNGRQAAVARVQDQAGAEHALRVQAVTSHAEHAYQVERLVAMTRVVTAAREHPQVYPAVLAVRESFVVKVPAAQVPVPSTGGGEYELWCDVMAWCPDDLNSWKRAVGPMVPPQVVVPLFVPVLATVAAVHEHLGIVHRDITTNNILLDAGGRLLLGDWGIAHGLASGHVLPSQPGFALPPQMLAGDLSAGRHTDAWYLGCLLSWMLTGETPGPQHGSGWVPGGLAAAGDMVRAVVAGLCAPDPRQRLTLPAAFATMAPALGPAQAVVPPPVVPTAGPAVPPAPPVGPVPGVVPVQGQVPMAPAGHVAAVPGAQVPVAPAPVGPPAPVPVAPVQVPVAPGPVVPVVQPVQPPVVPAGPGPAAQAPGAPVAPAVVPSGPAPGVPGQADAPGGSAWGTAESARWAGWSTPAIASTPAAEAPAPDDPPVRPASSRRRRAVVVMASVTVVFTALAAVVWGVSAATGRIGAIASPTPTRDRPTSTGPAHTGPEYVVWDGGDNLVLGEQAHTPTHVFVSQDQLPRTITCAPEGEAGSTHVTVDVDPLLLTDDVEVALEVGSACRVNLSVPTGLNFTIDWTGIRAAAGVPAAFIAVDFSDSATHLGVGHEVYDHIADADQPVLHLKVHAEGELYTWPSYTKWSDGRSVFGVPDRTFVRYWFPTTGQMPRSVTCTKTPVTGLDFRRAKLTADVEVPIDVADGCTSTTLLVSAEQNWTIEWTGKGAGVLDVVDGTGVAAQRLNTGTKTLSNTPHPGQPTVRLVVTSTTLVHVTPDRAVY